MAKLKVDTFELKNGFLRTHNEDLNGNNVITRSTIKFLDLRVPALYSLDELARKYRGKYRLDLGVEDNDKQRKSFYRRYGSAPSYDKDFTDKLLEWEAEINERSGYEAIIYVENVVDDCLPPEHFQYVINNVVTEDVKACFNPEFLIGCNCTRCSYKSRCPCLPIDAEKTAYDKNRRLLLGPGSPIYECNKNCKCSDACTNRVLQLGRKIKMKIFRTSDGRGWGVKSEEFILKGQFVVEYAGELISTEEAERRGKFYDAVQQTYLFDLDFYNQEATFTIDAYTYGNISHFFNHSCDPNCLVYSVWVDTLDPRLPRLGLFAKRNIEPGEELTFDYMMTRDCHSGKQKSSPSVHRDSAHFGCANVE